MLLSHTKSVSYLLQVQSVFICLYLLSAVFVADNSYNGFNSLLLGGVFLAFAGLTYYVLNVHINRTIFGAVLGSSCILVFIALESSIFWGQISNCSAPTTTTLTLPLSTVAPTLIGAAYRQSERHLMPHSYMRVSSNLFTSPSNSVSSLNGLRQLLASDHYRYGPECNSRTAMRCLCAFSVFMFLSYITQVGLLVYFKNDLLASSNNIDEDVEVPVGIDSTQQYNPYNISGLVRISMAMNRLEKDEAVDVKSDQWSIYTSSTEV